MVTDQIDGLWAVADARGGLARASTVPAVLALRTVLPAKLATSVDWTSPNLGTSIVFAAAWSVIRLIAANVARSRTLRVLAAPALTLGIVAALLASGAIPVVTLATTLQASAPTSGTATVSSVLALGGASGIAVVRWAQKSSAGGLRSGSSTVSSSGVGGGAGSSGGKSGRAQWLAGRRSAVDPTEGGSAPGNGGRAPHLYWSGTTVG